MSDNKNPQFKNVHESEKNLLEQVKHINKKKEKVEQSEQKEQRIEISPAEKKIVLDEISQAEKAAQSSVITPISDGQKKYSERQKQIEKIMENGLDDLYRKIPPIKQQEFKTVGEEIAGKINSLLNQAKFKIKDIINLIKKWLLIIPGVNIFFLEQEAKIKTDEIIRLKK